ncbi:MAG: class I SAM-dependent methyltransferase [Bacillota bacterium]
MTTDPMLPSSRPVSRRYDRLSAIYDFFDRMGRPEWRRKIFDQTSGEVLEVGVGTGKNIPFYRPWTKVTAVDVSPKMLARAQRRLDAAQPATKATPPTTPPTTTQVDVRLLLADAQALPFPDDSFDTVVDTFVFCSVPDPVAGLREVARVCRPGGRVIMLEHVRALGLAGSIMDRMNPLVVRMIGANINRRTVENVRLAGLTIDSVESFGPGGIIKLISARPGKKTPR